MFSVWMCCTSPWGPACLPSFLATQSEAQTCGWPISETCASGFCIYSWPQWDPPVLFVCLMLHVPQRVYTLSRSLCPSCLTSPQLSLQIPHSLLLWEFFNALLLTTAVSSCSFRTREFSSVTSSPCTCTLAHWLSMFPQFQLIH